MADQLNTVWLKFLPSALRRRIADRPNVQRVLGNAGWLFVDKIVRMVAALLVNLLLARYVGPEKFGIYSYALAFAALFASVASMGMDNIVVRELVNSPPDRNQILGTALLLRLGGGVIALILALGAILSVRPHDSLTQWLVGIIAASTIFQAFDIVDYWYQSRIQARSPVIARDAALLLFAMIKIALIVTGASLVALATASAAELALVAVALATVYRLSGERLRAWSASWAQAKRLLSQSWPLALSGIAIMIYLKIDLVMLGEMLGNDAVGQYSAATRLSEVWYVVPMVIVASVSPSIFEARKISKALYYDRLERLFRLMAALSLSLAIPMTFLADPLVLAIYGAEYKGAGTVLAIHIWAAIFVFLGVAQSPWTLAENLTKLSLIRTLVGAVSNVLLNLVLIPSYGPVGAAVATVISYALSSVMLNATSKATRGIFTMQLSALLCRKPKAKFLD